MPSLAELTVHVALLAVILVSLRWLRRSQPDPNPLIEAREAARLAAAAGISDMASHSSALLAAEMCVERRTQDLPYVGSDRRSSELAREIAGCGRYA